MNRFTFAALLPVVLVLVSYAREILEIWMGTPFSVRGATCLRILAAALLINAAAWPVYHLLQASGRPEIPARLHIVELVFHIPICAFLIVRLDITGAALAWLLRVVFDTAVLSCVANRSLRADLTGDTLSAARRPFAVCLPLLGPALAPKLLLPSLGRAEGGAILVVTGAAYCTIAALASLNAPERTLIVQAIKTAVRAQPPDPGTR